jgi:succinate dehydrogenase/fumarate reductase flavoprotein subunit
MIKETVVNTDVLVIGGGMAGCFAAIKAKEKGIRVTLVDKGYVSRSGQSPFAGAFAAFNQESGNNLDECMALINKGGEYINNRAWTEIVFKESLQRYKDLEEWGLKEQVMNMPGGRSPGKSPCDIRHLGWRNFATLLRKQCKKAGVNIMDRIMVTDLIRQDGRIAGATGISIEKEDFYAFKAAAVVLCTGAGGFRPPGWPISELTADGHIMAYRAGASITGKEFVDPHNTSAEYPAYFGHIMKDGRPIFGKNYNALGEEVHRRGGLFIDLEFEAHAGHAPITQETLDGRKITRVGGAASGMSAHCTEGIWPEGIDCSSEIPGLYAAGDALGRMQLGASYSQIGLALSGAAVSGALGGESAADFAGTVRDIKIDMDQVGVLRKNVFGPIERKGGFSPRWVTQQLQNIMIPYFIMYIKKQDRMEAALTLVEFMRDHLSPKLMARDPHELRLALETKNMIINAEMRLRSSIFRTESRGCHYREDFPNRDDKNWLAWVLIKEENGEMRMTKKDIPEEWKPDLSIPYEERYPVRFPGEKMEG